jgi:hypothetical protein
MIAKDSSRIEDACFETRKISDNAEQSTLDDGDPFVSPVSINSSIF